MIQIAVVTQPGHDGPTALSPQTEMFCEILSELGDVTVVGFGPDDMDTDNTYSIETVKSDSLKDGLIGQGLQFVKNQAQLVRTLQTLDVDIVFFYGATAYLIPAVAERLTGQHVLAVPKGNVSEELYQRWQHTHPEPIATTAKLAVRTLERIGFATATGIITYTPAMATSLGLDPNDPRVFTAGAKYVDTEMFQPTTPIDERPRQVTYCGRLTPEKNIRTLANVAKELPDVQFLFVGDGPERNVLTEGPNIVHVGRVPHSQVAHYLTNSRALIMASEDTEGLPNAILEAYACGTPVVAPAVGGIEDVLTSQTGRLVEKPTVNRLTDALSDVLGDDMAALSAECRSVATERFAFDNAVARYAAAINQLTTVTTERTDRKARDTRKVPQ